MAEPRPVQTSGEHVHGREAMERLQKRLKDQGCEPSKAEEIARETARRMDRKNYGRPK